MIYYLGEKLEGIDSVNKVSIENNAEGLKITIALICKGGYRIVEVAKELQRVVTKMVGTMTAFHIKAVDIEIKGLR